MGNLIFDNSFFRLSRTERFLVEAIFYFLFIASFILALIFLGDPKLSFRVLGMLLLIFLAGVGWRILQGQHLVDSKVVQAYQEGGKILLNQFIDLKTFNFLKTCFNRAESLSAETLGVFILAELLNYKEIKQICLRIGIDQALLKQAIEETFRQDQSFQLDSLAKQKKQEFLAELEKVISKSFEESISLNQKTIVPEAIFLAVFSLKTKSIQELAPKINFSREDFKNAIIIAGLSKKISQRIIRKRALADKPIKKKPRINRAWTSKPTPYLDSVSEDLTETARQGLVGFLIGHENELATIMNILSREERNNLVLIGEEDIGKTTIIEHLALRIIKDTVPEKIFDKRLVKLDLAQITSGATTAGEVQERFQKLVDEILLAGNIILFIPDLHNLALTVKEQELGGFEVIEPVLAASLIPVIGTTTPKLYRAIIETNPKFEQLFEPVKVKELNQEQTIRLLVYEAFILEQKWKLTITYPAIKKIVELAYRYLHSRPLPRVSIDLLQEAAAELRSKNQSVLTPELVADLVARKTNIPIKIAGGKEAKELLNLEENIHQRLINQDEAVKQVASALRQYRAGLSRPKGPIASFLFVGPTGVGKTELSKVLASLYFGSEDKMIRFDMSEYQEQKSIWNFIGSPDGEIHGLLTEKIKANPFSLILFDEFEKANEKIADLFLPLFDEGILVDNLDEKIDFQNAIIICTSNAHSNFIREKIESGKTVPEFQEELKHKLTEIFKPELLNRFDNIIAFRQLSLAEIEKIAALHLNKLAKQIQQTQGIFLEFAPETIRFIAGQGYDPVFGARPLRGVISQKIKDVLARQILEGKIGQSDKIKAVLNQAEVRFEKTLS
ncbi:MAG: ATP-dependent Clp protease ATP-binding subunit [Patescibacteria group bacterium]